MKHLIDQIWHRLRRMEFVPAEVINEETGTLDFDCTCRVCKWLGRSLATLTAIISFANGLAYA